MNDLYSKLCSYENLELAFRKARKGKTRKEYVIEFEESLRENLTELRNELIFHTYKPKSLKTFILRDPKTRKISKSDFRDRIIHHALCNIIEPIFDKSFIYDSYANRKGKGTLKAIKRFDHFKRKASKNFTRPFFVLKADIKHYFETVEHNTLITLIEQKIADIRIIWLVKLILRNHTTKAHGKGMPLGNLTSQFLANIYLDALDQFVKHILKAKHYIRYVDDFIILHYSKDQLEAYKTEIEVFLRENLALELHPDKSKIINASKGVDFLGMRIFLYHKLLRKKNLNKFKRKLTTLTFKYQNKNVSYDTLYDFLEGWIAHAKNANTYKLRKSVLKTIETIFQNEISTKELNRYLKQ